MKRATTKATFVREADAICAKADAESNKELLAYVKENKITGEPSSDQQTELVETVLLPNVQKQHDEIEALPVPDGEGDAVDGILEALDDGIGKAEADPESTFSEEPFDEATKLAKEYGLKTCGQN